MAVACHAVPSLPSQQYKPFRVLQGASTSGTRGAGESESDVRYPTLHKPGQKAGKAAPTVAAADPDSAEVQYPGIYKPNKKKLDSSMVSTLQGQALMH